MLFENPLARKLEACLLVANSLGLATFDLDADAAVMDVGGATHCVQIVETDVLRIVEGIKVTC